MGKKEFVWNLETKEKGVRSGRVVYTFIKNGETVIPSNGLIEAVIKFVESQKVKWDISHILGDLDDQSLSVFFREEEKPVEKNDFLPYAFHTIETYQNYPYGAKGAGSVWERYEKDCWKTEREIRSFLIHEQVLPADSPILSVWEAIEKEND